MNIDEIAAYGHTQDFGPINKFHFLGVLRTSSRGHLALTSGLVLGPAGLCLISKGLLKHLLLLRFVNVLPEKQCELVRLCGVWWVRLRCDSHQNTLVLELVTLRLEV